MADRQPTAQRRRDYFSDLSNEQKVGSTWATLLIQAILFLSAAAIVGFRI